MAPSLQDKVAVITGGGTGIGQGIARVLAERGAAVVLAQRRVEHSEAVATEIRATGGRASAWRVDVSQRAEVQQLLQHTLAEYGRLDIMVNNAAITGPPALGPFLSETDEHWALVIGVNLTGAFLCCQEAARQMIEQGDGGSIINISSVAAYAAQEHAAAYCASKSGLEGLTKTAAIELAPYKIRVNNLAPGDIYTEASADIVSDAKAAGATGRFFRWTPLGRRGDAAEIGRAVAFLASDDASFVTGTTLLVDGGFLSY